MTKRQLIDEEELGENIFLLNLKIDVAKMPVEGRFRVSETEKELMSGDYYLAERVKKSTYYQSPGNLTTIDSLPLQAKSLFLYMFARLTPNKDYFQLNPSHFMRMCSVSSVNTYKAALKELIKAKIIAPTGVYKNVFWINPYFIFSGSRIDKYPTKKDITVDCTNN